MVLVSSQYNNFEFFKGLPNLECEHKCIWAGAQYT